MSRLKTIDARCDPPASKASREVTNLTRKKNLHIYGVKEFVYFFNEILELHKNLIHSKISAPLAGFGLAISFHFNAEKNCN